MKLLNDLLNMHDGFEDDAWLKDCRKQMAETFPREDPFSILMPPGFDIDMVSPFVFFCLFYFFLMKTFEQKESMLCLQHQGPLRPPNETETDNTLLRVDFVREVDALLQEVRIEEDADAGNKGEGLDPEAIALKFKQQEKQRTIRQVEAILDLALNLKW